MGRAGKSSSAAVRRRRRRGFLLGAVALAAVTVPLAADAAGLLERAELRAYDIRMDVRGERDPPADVVIVAIDGRTLNRFDLRYPFPRALHARLIRTLAAASPKLIAYDVFFTERTARRQDRLLADALRVAERRTDVLLGAVELRKRDGAPSLFIAPARLNAIEVDVGSLILSEDRDGTFRRVDYSHEGITAFGVRGAELIVGRKLPTPGTREPAWVDLEGRPGTFSTVSFSDVIDGEVGPSFIRDKVVLVGATDVTLGDRHPVPPHDELMAGVEFQANALQTAREDYPLRDAGGGLDALLVIAMAMLAPLLAPALSIRWVAAAWTAAVAALVVASQLAFDAGVVTSTIAPLLAAVISMAGAVGVEEATVRRDRRRLRRAFARHLDPRVADQLLTDTESGGRLPGRQMTATVLFCDIRGWTAHVEATPAEEVVATLDRYLNAITETVIANGGAIVSFQGDGVMSVFGAPLSHPDHAKRALATARALAECLPRSIGKFEIGFGLASGDVISGTVGTGERLEYTVTGNPTNLAARLEGMTSERGSTILLADETRTALGGAEAESLREIGLVTVKGLSRAQRIWAADPS